MNYECFLEYIILVCFAVGVAGYTNSYLSLRSIDTPTDPDIEEPVYYKKRSDYDDFFNVKRAPSSISSLFQGLNEPNWR